MPEPITTHDDQHRRLARGAIRHAQNTTDLDMLNRLAHGEVVDVDVIAEAESAWAETGLMPASLSDREVREVCATIAGRVATVLVMVGWQPPARLLTDTAQPDPATEQPCVWHHGDPEPTNPPKVRDRHGDVWTYNDRNGLWYTPTTQPFDWEHITRKWGPVTEVRPADTGVTDR